MKNNKPIKLQTDPEYKRPNANANRKASGKKATNKNNRPLAIIHSVFKIKKDSRRNKTFYVLVALCSETQHPWKGQNFGRRIDKGSLREHLKNMIIPD